MFQLGGPNNEVHNAGEIWTIMMFEAYQALGQKLAPNPRNAAAGSLASPLPGIVRRVAAAPGDRVAAGALLVVVEAMKLEHRIGAPRAGRVREVLVAEGQEVDAGTPVAVLEEVEDG